MATVSTPTVHRLLLHNVSWREYTRLLRTFEERPHYRLTYDRGELEIMSPLPEHDSVAYLLGRFVDVLTEEMRLPMCAGRSTTFRLRKAHRGLEPDNCYWLANEARMRGKRHIDLRVDPPPDLAIEVDVTSSSLPRMRIYASLAIPEVWRFDGVALTFNMLDPSGRYTVETASRAIPGPRSDELLAFAMRWAYEEQTALMLDFRAWVQQRIAARWK